MAKMMGGGSKGNRSVTGKYPHSIRKGASMVGKNGKSGRKRGGKQRKMLT